MNVFDLRQQLIGDYARYVKSFIAIRDERIREHVDANLNQGLLWPEPRIGLNPSFAEGGWIDELVEQGVLHDECARIFRIKDTPETVPGRRLRLHRHQVEAIQAARTGRNYVLTTGTGSGKSLSYIVPIVDHVLRSGAGRGHIQAIVVYPMNALANSQQHELEKFLKHGYPDGQSPVTFERYTGQESDDDRRRIVATPPDILLTNYVMLELILTRTDERQLVTAARDLRFLVFDELHTYRGRQGADVALLARRVREACEATRLQCVGTSATMATGGSFIDQRRRVAEVASVLFGSAVEPENVIGETLRRATPPLDGDTATVRAALRDRLANAGAEPPAEFPAFVQDPLSRWIEGALGMQPEPETGRLVRVAPKPIGGSTGAARELADLTSCTEDVCASAIQRQLLAGSQVQQPDTGFPVFAFRLHQFISRGDTVYATLESEAARHLTVNPQTFVPGDRQRLLLPLSFCRECGHEYYVVRLQDGSAVGSRRLSDPLDDEPGRPGFLYVSSDNPWPEEFEEQRLRLPETWVETSGASPRLRSDRKKLMPSLLRVQPDGRVGGEGIAAWFVPAPFRFCLSCGISYGGRQRSDFPKLGTLGSEGRSTATTILSLSAIRQLRREEALSAEARKLLSFTDNRQDAALQAGHFNDFIEVGLLRSALYRAVSAAGSAGLTHEVITQRVFDALDLPLPFYAADPEVRFAALHDTRRALRDVIGYRLYRDLRRGWRITQPNLEQCGLLHIGYRSLDELCAAPDIWVGCHPALASATPAKREEIGKVLLDWMRRNLAIRVDYLDADFQERLQQISSQRLRAPWAIDENERLEHAAILFPRSKRDDDYRGFVFLSSRGAFGQYLRRQFPAYPDLGLADTDLMIPQLLKALKRAALVEEVQPERGDQPAGYQVPASSLVWLAGDGTNVEYDPLTVLRAPPDGRRANQFFIDFYRTVADDGRGLEAREHTAQVRADVREQREQRFKSGELPILFCSPTMELGVDISQLNVVSMRNVPPTPANYAQRSGRAGRSGQPALVFTYCSTGSSHDQYFFRRQEKMVSGQVAPPRIDLFNEDLVRAHLHAIWLAQTGMSLGSSLRDILDLGGDQPALTLLPSIRADVERAAARTAAREHAARVLGPVFAQLNDRWGDTWLDDAFASIARRFEEATLRWRTLYRAALAQAHHQTRIINDASRAPEEKQKAKKLRREAEAQVELLLATSARLSQSDFYSYRYFASEGFLPGYSFPRLPLSAFIPGRRNTRGDDEFLSRPRFLAISEFGPRNSIYHEGSRYVIYRAIFPVEPQGDASNTRAVPTREAKRCDQCGYLHLVAGATGPDLCEHCRAPLKLPMRQLFRMENVTTVRRDRITSDEEERQRLGYEIRSGLRFAETAGRVARQVATVQVAGGETVATLSYGHTATIWRINYGWRRRKPGDVGFVISVDTGEWAKREEETASDGETVETPHGKTERVIPYVDDRRNCLLIEPRITTADPKQRQCTMAALQAALKNAVQITYQLEDAELAAEPLPDADNRQYLLLYESAEGGAGVLRRLVEDPGALAEVARAALELCHFDPTTGDDLGHAPNATERCEAACYDCLMSYGNQPDHRNLDRFLIRDLLLAWTRGQVAAAPGEMTRAEHLQRLQRLAASDLERRWLRYLHDHGYRLPTDGAVLVAEAGTRPDFSYDGDHLVVYVDGPHHQFPERAARDARQTEALRDLGYSVVRFAADEDWDAVLRRYPSVFGNPGTEAGGAHS